MDPKTNEFHDQALWGRMRLRKNRALWCENVENQMEIKNFRSRYKNLSENLGFVGVRMREEDEELGFSEKGEGMTWVNEKRNGAAAFFMKSETSAVHSARSSV